MHNRFALLNATPVNADLDHTSGGLLPDDMRPEGSATLPLWTQNSRRWTPTATWALWAILAVVICGFYLKQQYRSVAINYRNAAMAWRASEEMYNTNGDGFLYLPQAALVFLPLTYLPVPVGDVIWRLIGMAWLALALRSLCRLLHPAASDAMFWIVSLVTLPLAFSALRNGQSTIHMTAAMLSAAHALAQKEWTKAAFWLCLGMAFKPLIVVMLLLAGAVYPALRLRLVAGIVLLALSPFLMQWPAYVVDQYQDMLAMLRISYQVGESQALYAHFWGLCRVWLECPGMVTNGYQTPCSRSYAGWLLADSTTAQPRSHSRLAVPDECDIPHAAQSTDGTEYLCLHCPRCGLDAL